MDPPLVLLCLAGVSYRCSRTERQTTVRAQTVPRQVWGRCSVLCRTVIPRDDMPPVRMSSIGVWRESPNSELTVIVLFVCDLFEHTMAERSKDHTRQQGCFTATFKQEFLPKYADPCTASKGVPAEVLCAHDLGN